MGSTYNTHVDIPTPTWRTLPTHRPLSPSDPEHAISDDDTDDEACVRRHETAAQEERARLAGFLRKKNSSGTPKKEASSSNATPKRLRSSSKPLEAIFPGPFECWKLVEAAKSLHGQTDEQCDKRSLQLAELRRNLDKFSMSLECLSALESLLTEEKGKLQRALAKRSYLNTDVGRSHGAYFPNGTSGNGSAAPNPKQRRTHGSATKSIEAFLLQKALGALESTELAFRSASQDAYSAMESLLSQTNWALPSSKSFVELQKSFEQARHAPAKRRDPGASRPSLSEIIKGQINTETYKVVADAFKLNPLYKMDGRESVLPGARRLKRKRPSPISGLHDGKIYSHGFCLDIQKAKPNEASSSDLESGLGRSLDIRSALRARNLRRRRTVEHRAFSDPDNIGIVPQTPSSGMTTPSQPSTPSSLRRVNKDHPIHDGDMHLQVPLATPDPHLRRLLLSNEELKETGGNQPNDASAAQNEQCDTTKSSAGISHEPLDERAVSGVKPQPTDTVCKISDENKGEKIVGENRAQAQSGSKSDQEVHSKQQAEPGTEDVPPVSEKQLDGLQKAVLADEIPLSDKHADFHLERGPVERGNVQDSSQQPGPSMGVQDGSGMESHKNAGGFQFPVCQAEGVEEGRSNGGNTDAIPSAVISIVIPDTDSGDITPPESDSREHRAVAAGANERTFKTEQDSPVQESAVPESNGDPPEVITIE